MPGRSQHTDLSKSKQTALPKVASLEASVRPEHEGAGGQWETDWSSASQLCKSQQLARSTKKPLILPN